MFAWPECPPDLSCLWVMSGKIALCFDFKFYYGGGGFLMKIWVSSRSIVNNIESDSLIDNTVPDGAVVKSSAKGLVGTGFASGYRLQPRAGF